MIFLVPDFCEGLVDDILHFDEIGFEFVEFRVVWSHFEHFISTIKEFIASIISNKLANKYYIEFWYGFWNALTFFKSDHTYLII